MLNSPSARLETFLAQCALSSNDTIHHFEQVLAELEQAASQTCARLFLIELLQFHASQDHHEFLSKYHFSFIKIDLSNQRDASEHLILLQFPSTFTPEAWSYTFFEGLSRYEFSEFANKKLVELGCGKAGCGPVPASTGSVATSAQADSDSNSHSP